MSRFPLVARLLLGLIFTVFGVNKFFGFLPEPELPPAAGEFIGALIESGYLWTLLTLTEITCGVLLLLGRFVPLALTILAPVVVNIITFHLFLAPSPEAMAVPVLVLALELYLAYAYRKSFRGVLDANAQPS